ncbi:MAG: hypothetical protein QG608_2766 [Actinomycetota bacterium]|nr:hypothetical protein [Actinomycetota bacterium]
MLAAGTLTSLQWDTSHIHRLTPAEGSRLLHGYERVLSEAKAIGRTMSPAAVVPLLIPQIHTLRELSRRSSATTRPSIGSLAARYCEYAAWMSQESGDCRAAQWWVRHMRRSAEEADDKNLIAYADIRLSSVTLYDRDARATTGLAVRAGSDSSLPPRTRRSAALREAQGHALAGDEKACFEALERAAVLSGSVTSDAHVALGSTSTENHQELVRGWCLLDLGRPEDSARTLEESMPSIQSTAFRATARFGVRRALALAQSGDVEQACLSLHEYLPLVAVIDSETVRSDLVLTQTVLSRWRSHRPARSLLVDIQDVLGRGRGHESVATQIGIAGSTSGSELPS